MEKKSKRGPLLYVSQTFLNTPVKNMQEVYTSRQEVQLPIEEPQLEEEGSKKKGLEVSLAKKDLPKVEKEKSVKQEQNIQVKEENSRVFNKVKSFRDMSLMERLEYLENFPKALPPVPCVFHTEDKHYQGYLVEYNEQDVTIRFPNEATETIPFKNLKNVMMIGIKR